MVEAPAPQQLTVADLTNTVEVVKLMSNDQHKFYLNCDVAAQSKKLNEEMKTAPHDGDAQCKVINLDLNAKTLETVVKYLHYRIINSRLSVSDRAVFDIEPEDALDILNAGIYLQC